MQKTTSYGQGSKQHADTKLAERVAILYNIISIIIGLTAFFTEDKHTAFFITLLYPLLGIVIMMLSKGLIKLVSPERRKLFPNILFAFLVIYLTFYIVIWKSYDIVSYESFWLPFISITIIMTLFFILTGINWSAGWITLQAIGMLILAACYGAGSTIAINCVLDNSPPIKFNTVVENKRVTSSRRSKEYHLILTPWQRGQESIDIQVSAAEYEQTPVDGPVGGHIKSGYLHIRWFYLDL